MKSLIFLFLFSLLTGIVSAQDTSEPAKKNSIFLEYFGNGSFYYSLNYDRIMLDKPSWKLAARIGAMYHRQKFDFFVENGYRLRYNIPIEISYLRGKGNNYLELGAGVTYLHEGYDSYVQTEFGLPRIGYIKHQNLNYFGRIGYRYQKTNGGVFFKVGFTPSVRFIKGRGYIASANSAIGYILSAGLSIGYTLKH